MARGQDHVGAYNFTLEISGVTVGFARQVQIVEETTSPPAGGGVLGSRAPVGVQGAGSPFSGQYHVPNVTHNLGGGQSQAPGARLVPSQVRVVVLGLMPAGQHGAAELSRWWGQKNAVQLGTRPLAIIQRDAAGHELRRQSMDGWLVEWQGPPPVPGRPDPPPETARVVIGAANFRQGR